VKRLLAATALAASVLSACTIPESEPSDKPSQAPVEKVKVEKNAQYDLPDDIVDAAESGGYECGERIDRTSLNYFATACENGGHFTTYADRADRDEWLDGNATYGTLDDGKAFDVLVGPNWTVQCDDDTDTCTELRRILGGKPALSELL
jgi:hypothetical protein